MSIDYTIAAIPTEYKGRKYRSRLEARWAAFFDQIGASVEYEPFDLGTWSPDFSVRLSPKYPEHSQILVEVKPIQWGHDDYKPTFERLKQAVISRGIHEKTIVALVGCAPDLYCGRLCLGIAAKWTNGSYKFRFLTVGWLPMPDNHGPEMFPDLFTICPKLWNDHSSLVVGCSSAAKTHLVFLRSYPAASMELWSKATNTVQWLGRNV